MAFPGIALIIDELFELAYYPPEKDPGRAIQQNSFIGLKDFFEENGIAFSAITDTSDIGVLKKRINSYSNVRLLVLDLDLNDDGEVGEEDDFPLIHLILGEALNKFGYFLLLINSAHSEKWDDIKKGLPDKIKIFASKNSPVEEYDKNSEKTITEKLSQLKDQNYSLELIYSFEGFLNDARDKAFQGLIDSEKRTWNKIYKQIHGEAGDYANYIVSDLLMSLVKQHMLDCKYSIPANDDPIDESIAIKAFINASYINNETGSLSRQAVWTGNLYYIENPSVPFLHYALIVTPECDIAQGRFINFQILCGYEINETTFPSNFDHNAYPNATPPIHALKNGKSKGKWKTKEALGVKANFIEHLYTLPFSSKNYKSIVLDFRDLTFISASRVQSFELVRRVGEPMITDVMNKISGIFNRKGLPPILPLKINPLV